MSGCLHALTAGGAGLTGADRRRAAFADCPWLFIKNKLKDARKLILTRRILLFKINTNMP